MSLHYSRRASTDHLAAASDRLAAASDYWAFDYQAFDCQASAGHAVCRSADRPAAASDFQESDFRASAGHAACRSVNLSPGHHAGHASDPFSPLRTASGLDRLAPA